MIQRIQITLFRLVFIVTAALTMLSARTSFGQQATPKDWPFGYQAFNLLLQESDIKICSEVEWINTPADEKFAILIDKHSSVNWGPVMEGVPTLMMASSGQNLGARFRPTLGLVEENQLQDFYLSRDCPVIRPDSNHEVFLGVRSLICNTPGYISKVYTQPVIDQQLYPRTQTPRRGLGRQEFSSVSESPVKRVWVADPLLFSNQMFFKADNLRFADNTLRWLSDDYRRKKVLLLIKGAHQTPVDPADLDILTPVPTREEVFDALSKIPFAKTLEFGDACVQAIEDENVLNDIAHKYTDRLLDGQILRLIIFAIFTCCLAFGLVTYFWQRRVLRRTSSVTANRRQQNLSKREGGSDAVERQAAASLLLNAFCLEVAERRLADWPEFPTPIVSQNNHPGSPAVQATNEMADAYWKLRTKPKTYWTKQTLVDLEQATNNWRQLISENEITIRTMPA